MAYNLTNITSANTTLKFWQEINHQLSSYPSIAILLIFYIVIFSYALRTGKIKAHVAASFVTTTLAGLMLALGTIGWHIAAVPFSLLLLGIIAIPFMGD